MGSDKKGKKKKNIDGLWRNSKIKFFFLSSLKKNCVGPLEKVIQSKLWIKKVIAKIIRLFNLCFNGVSLEESLSLVLLWSGDHQCS